MKGSAMDALRVAFIRLGLQTNIRSTIILLFGSHQTHITRDDAKRHFPEILHGNMNTGRHVQRPIQIDEQAENDVAVDDPVATHDPVVIPDDEPNQPPAANDRHPYVRSLGVQ
ncbi:unnamed protein product [Phytophthora fragariaefolia]|uniref:Unnamed protein product n=1 Tax=Phytophthora fragariaefolia TaxID=1490495 RepID=A0A9W6U7I8_9STRA|nr:unnamed protein product [Phytophthora fragariaefolia]